MAHLRAPRPKTHMNAVQMALFASEGLMPSAR